MDRGAWRAIVHGVTKGQTRLSDWHYYWNQSTQAQLTSEALSVLCELKQCALSLTHTSTTRMRWGSIAMHHWTKLALSNWAQFSSVQSLSRVRLFATPWIAARQASLSITNSRSSPRLTSIESVMPSSHLILYCPLLLLPPIPPSNRVFSNESTLCMRWPK